MEEMYAMPINEPTSDSTDAGALLIAIIDSDDLRRQEVANALAGFEGTKVQEYDAYPADLEDLPLLLDLHYDAIILGIDEDPGYAFDVVEAICLHDLATVMVYSEQNELDLAIRFMRAGAREFLPLPLGRDDMAGALARVSIRRSASTHGRKSSPKKLFTFLGAKGGCGVTTIASNFAIALAQESNARTLLIDFGLPLGDVAINLGMVAQYSTANALQDTSRLDTNFLRSLLSRHSSGLFVLPAPSEFSPVEASNEAIDKLLAVARQSFDFVVVDAGSRIDLRDSVLFEESVNLYLITQVGVSELRNANRLVTQYFSTNNRKLQIVLNRYTSQSLLFDEQQITKALTKPASWKIPDDYSTTRRTQNSARPIALQDTPVSKVIRQMARTACGLPPVAEKKKQAFSLFRPFTKAQREADEPGQG
jgi:pilus assembly protein CpaE